MTRRAWTAEERQLLASMYPHCHTSDIAAWLDCSVTRCYAMAQRMGLHKTEEFLASSMSGRLQPGQVSERMIAGRWRAGLVPWNKGKSYHAGGRSVATQFKPGHQSKKAAPIGAYRIDSQGLLQRKISNAHGSNSKRWRGVHELVWVEANGPLPPGHVVAFKPGQRTNVLEEITLSRVECISRGQMGARNHPINKSPEYARLVQLKGAITRQVNRIAQEAAQKKST